MKIGYFCPDQTSIDDVVFQDIMLCDKDLKFYAELAAQYEFNHRGGYEWMPKNGGGCEITLVDENLSVIGRFYVEINFVPEFCATENKNEQNEN